MKVARNRNSKATVSPDVQTIVVGAGVIGLAIASKLAQAGHDVLIIESKHLFGSETSARNSEVIHAGIYYEKDSLKAQLCTRGKKLLYQYCEQHAVPFKRLEKIIVACSEQQVEALHGIRMRAQQNGVDDLQLLSEADVAQLEPAIKAKAGLLSPSTGIVDSHAFMLSLLGKAEQHGAMIAYNSCVQSITPTEEKFGVRVIIDDDATHISCENLINAAGHGACALAEATTGLASDCIPTPRFSKGNYFRLQDKTPVSRLIYPVPEPGGLGVHITIDMAGQSRFGPDVQPQNELNYHVDETRSAHFYHAIRRYWPALKDDTLVPDYAGVRPKIEFNGKPYNDFIIQNQQTHNIKGLVNLFGIESPGLTASLAIAELVRDGLSR